VSKKEKLIKRLLSRPKDFTFDEMVTLLGYLDYYQHSTGKTAGSRVVFINGGKQYLKFHKPHPGNELNPNTLSDVIEYLKGQGLL